MIIDARSAVRMRLFLALSIPLAVGCQSSSVHLYEGPQRSADALARIHTGEGFWGDKQLFLAQVNGTRLWDSTSSGSRMFKAFVVKNDVHVLPGSVELVAGEGQVVRFEGEAGATYRLSLEPSAHDTVPTLVVAAEGDGRIVTDSEPRADSLSVAPWELQEGWAVVDWLRYRPPHAEVLTDVITYERSMPADAGENWSGLTWMTSIGLDISAQLGDCMALSGDMLLDLEVDYRHLTIELVQDSPRLMRWSGSARDGGRTVSGLVLVGRANDTLRAISCVGPGPWASRSTPIEARLLNALELAR